MFLHINELKLLISYYFISFFFTLIICLQKFFSLLIFFYYPISKLIKKKLLVLNSLDLLHTSWLLSLNISFLVSILIFNWIIKLFFSNSWYFIQKKTFSQFSRFIFIILILLLFISVFFFKLFFQTILFWSSGIFNSFNLFEIQLQIFQFINFENLYLNAIWFIIILFYSLFLIIKSFITWNYFFLFFSLFFSFSKFFIFFFLSLFSIDLDLLLLFSNLLILEFIFFYICFKLNILQKP